LQSEWRENRFSDCALVRSLNCVGAFLQQGEGNFGEVFKASLQGTLSVTAAIKTLKVSDGTGRAELLGEAALMALFNHPNVVQLLGVVTVPRNMPALLVIE
jgi:serine/threonine protein kinase